jgi:hypothetical protein
MTLFSPQGTRHKAQEGVQYSPHPPNPNLLQYVLYLQYNIIIIPLLAGRAQGQGQPLLLLLFLLLLPTPVSVSIPIG